LSTLDPISCGQGTTPRDKSTWVVNTLNKTMEHFEPILILDEEAPLDKEDMDTNEKQARVDLQH